MFKYRYKNKKSNICLFVYMALLLVVFLSVGYSAFTNDLHIDDIVANVKPKTDIRITGVDVDSFISDCTSNYVEYNVDKIFSDIILPNSDSSITYAVEITNFGSINMGIFDITGLPNNLDMDIEGYNFKDKICNDNQECNLGIVKEFNITIRYKVDENGVSLYDSSNTEYNIELDFEFRNFVSINYIGFVDFSSYLVEIISGDDLNINFNNFINDLSIRVNNVFLDSSIYFFDGYNLIINNVENDIDIINFDGSTFLSGIEFNYLIKNGEYAPEGDVEEYYDKDANRLEDYTVKKIIFGKMSDYMSDVSQLIAEPIDVYRTGIINLYRKQDTDGKYIVYILSKNGEFILNENASWTFDKLYALEEIVNLHLLDTSNVVKMRDMFCDCASIKSLDLSNFDTSKVTNMIGMFARMTKLEYLDLSSFDTSNLVTMNQMFTSDSLLKKIYVSDKWKITDKLESGTGVFTSCENLVGGNGTVLGSNVTSSMAIVDTINSPGYLTNGYKFLPGVEFNHIIKNLSQTQIDSWTTSNRYSNTDISSIIFGKNKDYLNVVSSYSGKAVDSDKSGVIKSYRVPNGDGTYVVYVLSNSGNFVVNEDASWMFDKLLLLKGITNLKMLNTNKTSNMRDMFCDCQYLESIDLSNFDTRNATTFEGMFARMYMVEVLDLSNFTTVNLTSLKNTFSYNISSTETHESLMNVVPALKTIYVSDGWNPSKVTLTDLSFSNCVNLVGGNGTVFNSNNITATYARIDTFNTPGYFTKK